MGAVVCLSVSCGCLVALKRRLRCLAGQFSRRVLSGILCREKSVDRYTFSDDALSLIVRSSEGGLRKARNLCLAALLEAVRDRTKTVELKQVNRVLLQPHWRKEVDLPH